MLKKCTLLALCIGAASTELDHYKFDIAKVKISISGAGVLVQTTPMVEHRCTRYPHLTMGIYSSFTYSVSGRGLRYNASSCVIAV